MRVVIKDKPYEIRDLTLVDYEFAKNIDKLGAVQIIHLFTGAPMEDIKDTNFIEIKKTAALLSQNFSINNVDEKLQEVITFKDKQYGLIYPSKVSFEEWINLEVFLANENMDLPLVAAHLYKPLVEVNEYERVLEPYSLEECQKRAQNEFKDFPIRIFTTALFFLSTFALNFTDNILSYLEMKTTDNK